MDIKQSWRNSWFWQFFQIDIPHLFSIIYPTPSDIKMQSVPLADSAKTNFLKKMSKAEVGEEVHYLSKMKNCD